MNKIVRKLIKVFSFNYWYALYVRRKYGITVSPDVNLSIRGKFIVGKDISIGRFSNILVAENSSLTIGDDVWINDNCHIETCSGQSIKIGARTTLQSRCQIRGDVIIENDVLFAPNVFISSGSHLYSYIPELKIREQDKSYKDNHGIYYSKQITIGEDSWLGINVVVMPGVTIKKCCVVGSNSVVTKDFDVGSILVGTPAKKIKSRF